MGNEKPVKKGAKPVAPAPAAPIPQPKIPVAPVNPPPLFRKIDWLAFAVTTLLVFIGYFLTLAPDLTLEDSGELATGSFYAGIPHPPGYPVWTIYTWFWTVILPYGSVAWRVAVGEALSGALACGLLAFIVSRGSSMMMESVAALKNIDRRWENTICVVSGFVTGMLMGFDGFMWSQSVIVEVYSFSVLSLVGTLCCLLRWVYAPHQRRYLYLAFFIFGVCFTNHQTLICATMGIEVLILAADRRVGRDLFMGNTLVYGGILVLMHFGNVTSLSNNPSLLQIFHIVGVLSALTFLWFTITTRKTLDDWIELVRDIVLLGCAGYLLALVLFAAELFPPLDSHSNEFLEFHGVGVALLALCTWLTWLGPKRKEGNTMLARLYLPLLILSVVFVLSLMILSGGNGLEFLKGSLGMFWAYMLPGLAMVTAFFWLTTRQRELGADIKVGVVLGAMWVLGASLYLYMAVAGMSCPPMQWGYPRTVDGFFHALSRGQYGVTVAADILHHPFDFISKLPYLVEGIADEFNWAYTLLALVPFLFFPRMQKRERAWLIGLTAIYFSLAVLLLILLQPSPDRQSRELNRVFFTASHVIVAMLIGYGITMLTATLLAVREMAIRWLPLAALLLSVTALDTLVAVIFEMYGNNVVSDGVRPLIYGLVSCGVAALLWLKYETGKLGVLITSALAAAVGAASMIYGVRLIVLNKVKVMDCVSVVLHGLKDKLKNGDATLEVYGAAVMVAGVVLALVLVWLGRNKLRMGLLLAIVAIMPFYSVLSHWSDNEQRGHWFGYWFGHDMFTPPFVAPDGKLSYDPKLREQAMKGPSGKLVYPEMTRDTILFGGTDPGRVFSTNNILLENFNPASCKPMDPNYDRRDVYIITQNALADGTYLEYLRSQYNRSAQIDPPFFQQLLRLKDEREPQFGYTSYTNYIAHAAYDLLDKPFTALGAKIEARRRREGVYPPKEIYIPSPEDSQQCFNEYLEDVKRRLYHDQQFPNEPRQIRGGEDPQIVNNRVTISGQVSVMAINGLLTKVIFDHNPTNEFFVEESFPLDWMYPHLTPFGVIMKINRQPLPELTEDILQSDHEFWAKYSDRLIGNWITYDTPVQKIADFAEKVYLRRDFSGFSGDRKFIRDDSAQKAFSKLRSSIAGIYAWRLGLTSGAPTPPQYLPKSEAERQRIIKEADFAFKQAFAYCPYSPEAVYRYINLLAMVNRYADALIVAETCLKLDPGNGPIKGLVNNLRDAVGRSGAAGQPSLQQLEQEVKEHPSNYQALFRLANTYVQMQKVDRCIELLDSVVDSAQPDANAVRAVVQAYAQLSNAPKLEKALEKLVKVDPGSPEAWYDLATIKASFGKNSEALPALSRALVLSDSRRAANPNERDIRAELTKDTNHFASLRDLPEFKRIIAPQ
jgi:thioredoxin-like negative regulator of GroEL